MYIHQNIKFLRLRKVLTQVEAAARLGFSRSQLAGYESTIKPTLEALLALSAYFCVSTDSLLKIEMATLTEFKIREVIQGNESYFSGNKLRVLTVAVDVLGADQVELVPVKAKAGYMNGYSDPEYIGDLPVVSFPFLPKNRKHRMFQLEGDSMLPMNSKSYVICSYLDNWNQLEEGSKYVILTRQEGIVFKLVFFKTLNKSILLLCSSNTQFKPYELSMEEVLEIWKFEFHLTAPPIA